MIIVKVGRCLIQQRCAEIGITQRQLADRLQRSETQISDWATNRTIMSMKTAKEVAYILNCVIDDLYEWIIYED